MAKIATSIEQGKALLKLGIDRSSADMYWWYAEGKNYLYVGTPKDDNAVPAWSLDELMYQLPQQIYDEEGSILPLNIIPFGGKWRICYDDILYARDKNIIEAVVTTLCKLHEERKL